jgi:hypothetical protein
MTETKYKPGLYKVTWFNCLGVKMTVDYRSPNYIQAKETGERGVAEGIGATFVVEQVLFNSGLPPEERWLPKKEVEGAKGYE